MHKSARLIFYFFLDIFLDFFVKHQDIGFLSDIEQASRSKIIFSVGLYVYFVPRS